MVFTQQSGILLTHGLRNGVFGDGVILYIYNGNTHLCLIVLTGVDIMGTHT